MSQAPDVTDPSHILSLPDDPRVHRFQEDPPIALMHWTPDLQGPQASSADDDLLGHSEEAVAQHMVRYSKWESELQAHLAASRWVIVRNWFPNGQTDWNVDSISKFKGSMTQKIQFQGQSPNILHSCLLTVPFLDAKLRAQYYHLTAAEQGDHEYHITVPFHEFITQGINNPDSCGNCLDSPGLRAEVPPFIM